MAFIKAALALMGWAFLCLLILNIPAFHKISSRAVLILLVAALLGNNIPLLPDRPWLALLLWISLSCAVVIPLTLLPRVKCAGIFMVSFLSFYAVMRLITEKIIPILFKNFQKTGWTTVIVWALAILGSFLFVAMAKEDVRLPELKQKVFNWVDRFFGSFILALSLLAPMLLYSDHMGRFFLAAGILTVAVWFLDALLFSWFLNLDLDPPPTQEELEAEQRREERREKRRNSLPAKLVRGTFRGIGITARAGVKVLHLGGAVVSGIADLAGLNVDNPIPDPAPLDPYAQMEKDYREHILPQEKMAAEIENQKNQEAALKFYEENYR